MNANYEIQETESMEVPQEFWEWYLSLPKEKKNVFVSALLSEKLRHVGVRGLYAFREIFLNSFEYEK